MNSILTNNLQLPIVIKTQILDKNTLDAEQQANKLKLEVMEMED